MVGTTFVASAGLAIGQSGVNALFLQRVGADALPATYLLQGLTAFVLMLALTGLLGRVERRIAYLAIPAALAIVVVAERAILVTDARWIYVVLWLTVAFGFLAQNVCVWGVAGAVTDARRAKRLFPLFASGDILGSVVGGLLTGRLAQSLGAENLLAIWAAALIATFVLCRAVLPVSASPATRYRRPRSGAVADLRRALGYVWRSPLLRWMTVAAVLFSVLFFSLFLPWAAAATERYANADDLAGFFGLFWGVTTGIAFLVSILATNRLFVWLGVTAMVVVLPVLYAGSFAILVVTSTFTALVALRFVDGVWLQGVASPAWETLTNVVPESRRDQVRAFINGGPAQAGTAIAGVIALVGQEAFSSRQLAVIGLAAAVITVIVAIGVRRSYASALLEALRAGRPHVFEEAPTPRVPFTFERDAEVLRTVLEASVDEEAAVRRLAVALLAQIEDDEAYAAVRRALADPDAGVRAEAAAAIARSPGIGREAVRPLVEDLDPLVAASAAVVALGSGDDAASFARLQELAAHPDPDVRVRVAERLRSAGTPVVASVAGPLVADPAAEVRAAALETMATAAPDAALEAAVRALDDLSPTVRRAAARAAARIGTPALPDVLAALGSPGAREAALEALARIDVSDHLAAIRFFIDTCVEETTRDLRLALRVPADDEPGALLRDGLLERARRNARVALRAMSLLSGDGEAMRVAIDHLDGRDPGQLATALETLEATADTTLLRPLLPLWEPAAGRTSEPSQDAVRRATEDDDAFIRSCAAFALRPGGGDGVVRTRTEMPVMERVLFLRKVPLFDALEPSDLHAIAQVAEDQTFAEGDVLAAQGEVGDALHIVVSGAVRVETDGATIARRGPGEVVGEMSLVTREPRIATLVGEGDVRAIRIGRREFEGMVHDRPDIALGVIRVLARRLAEIRPVDPAPA